MAPLSGHSRYGSTTKRANKADVEILPSMDLPAYYDPPSPASSSCSSIGEDVVSKTVTNAGSKLEPNARWQRKGKICAWGPTYEETVRKNRTRKRLQLCLEQMMPEAAAEIGTEPPQNILDAEERRRERKRRKQEEAEYRLPHLQSPSPPLSTVELAPMLALPRSYLDVVTSPAMRHSLGDDSMERGLQKTAADLLEGEKGLMQALGRLREVLRVRERDVPEGTAEFGLNGSSAPTAPPTAPASEAPVANGASAEVATNGHYEAGSGDQAGEGEADPEPDLIPPLPHVSDTDNLWRVSQELLSSQSPPIITFAATPPGKAAPTAATDEVPPRLTPVHRMFTCPSGITLNSTPNTAHPSLQGIPITHPLYPREIKYNLDLPTQQRAVDDAIERIMELLADCNEYKERLEEARERVGDVARVRKTVWKVVKRRAGRELDRMEGKA